MLENSCLIDSCSWLMEHPLTSAEYCTVVRQFGQLLELFVSQLWMHLSQNSREQDGHNRASLTPSRQITHCKCCSTSNFLGSTVSASDIMPSTWAGTGDIHNEHGPKKYWTSAWAWGQLQSKDNNLQRQQLFCVSRERNVQQEKWETLYCTGCVRVGQMCILSSQH